MTLTLAGADIRGFYGALGIVLPAWSATEASVRCFADPDAHRRGDRDPSCSVNLLHGAWRCHGCGASGGAFDAAIVLGNSDRSAIDLMVEHRLVERRAADTVRRRATRVATAAPTSQVAAKRLPTELTATDRDIARWRRSLDNRPGLVSRLAHDRGWRYTTMRDLELGVDGGRITIPTRTAAGELAGVLRYRPWPGPGPKVRAMRGSERSLAPHPAAEPSREILLVEGEPDMVAARSHGLPAIAVPGVDGWRPEWAELLSERTVTIAMDADGPGRRLARQIAHELCGRASVSVLDLAPGRDDGYDLTDWLSENPRPDELGVVMRRQPVVRRCNRRRHRD